MKNKLIFSILFSTVVLGLAGIWYSQRNVYSKELLKLEILGSERIDLGQEVEYTVKYKNNGEINLENPKLTFEFPEFSFLDDGKPLRQEIGPEELGEVIYPGQERTIKFKGRIMGKEGEIKTVKASLDYRPKNLSAWYKSQTEFSSEIKSIPLTFSFDDLPSRLEPGRELTFKLNYYSNISFPISNLKVKIDYPSGFEFKKSVPKSLEQKEWDIGTLNKGQGGRIEISGVMNGNIGEQQVFSAKLGTFQDGNFILLKEDHHGINLARPSLYIDQRINGNPEYIADPGDNLHYEIFFRNLGQETLKDLFLVVKLTGDAFDLSSIRTINGDFKSGDNSIVFDYNRNSQLRFLASQEEGKVEFWINLKNNISEYQGKNPTISNEVVLLQNTKQFETKINLKLEIVQRGFFYDEIFGNSGPIPPRVGEPTTYTIHWQVKNHFNDVENVKVKAVLPKGVELTGRIFPESQFQRFAFDYQSREIVWDLGSLAAGTGVTNSAPNIAFQISLTPTSNQRGKAVLLINEARISGEDEWTGQFIGSTDRAIDTRLPHDTNMTTDKGIVQ
jgi:hypothetical protein